MHHNLLLSGLVLLGLAVIAVVCVRRLKLPAILAYLFVGVVAGPNALAWVESNNITILLGEIGIVFLLFTIGLEFSISKLNEMRHILLKLGSTQVLIGTLSGMGIAMLLGISWQAALIIGGALSLSSTAIVIKQLAEQLELKQDHGRIAVGVLLFQDLAAVPFLIMIPILATGNTDNLATVLLIASLKGLVAVVIMLLIGRWGLRPLFHEVAKARSAELFTLTILLVVLAAAWGTNQLGLSLALGAFMIGMMLGETEYRHHIETDIRPFRDVLLGLFFVTVGMQLDLKAVSADWPWVLLLVIGIMVGKGSVIAILTKLMGQGWQTALRSGLTLGQGSEFGIALLALAVLTNLISTSELQPILASIILSMAIAPMLIHHSDTLLNTLFKHNHKHASEALEQTNTTTELNDHIIICGYGNTGQRIVDFLEDDNIPYACLEHDANLVKHAWQTNKNVFYGDVRTTQLLEALGLQQASAVIISFENMAASSQVIRYIRQSNYNLPIIARARNAEQAKILSDAGANTVVPEDLETSLMLTTQLLLALDIPIDDVMLKMRLTQEHHYAMLRKQDIDKQTSSN